MFGLYVLQQIGQEVQTVVWCSFHPHWMKNQDNNYSAAQTVDVNALILKLYDHNATVSYQFNILEYRASTSLSTHCAVPIVHFNTFVSL